jgi:hypothetical protein
MPGLGGRSWLKTVFASCTVYIHKIHVNHLNHKAQKLSIASVYPEAFIVCTSLKTHLYANEGIG